MNCKVCAIKYKKSKRIYLLYINTLSHTVSESFQVFQDESEVEIIFDRPNFPNWDYSRNLKHELNNTQ